LSRSADEQRKAKDFREALHRFERATELRPDFPPYLVRRAFMYEQRGDYARAEDLYRNSVEAMRSKADWMPPAELEVAPPMAFYSPDNYQAYKHLGDVLMRQATSAELAEGDAGSVRDAYAEAARVYRDALMTELNQQIYWSYYLAGSAPSIEPSGAAAAVSNLGVVLLKAGNYGDGVEILETLVRSPVESSDEGRRIRERTEILAVLAGPYYEVLEQWTNSYYPELPAPDDRNPVFRLNLGWAYELRGKAEKAREQYLIAVKSDPTFHPAMNDLGVLAAKDGALDEAKRFFHASLKEKPDYAYAAHNLGVALLRSGPADFFAGQGYVARAVSQDSSLAQTSYDYIFDNELYFLNLSLAGRIPPDWAFAARAERSAFYVSAGAVALLLWRIIRRTAYDKGWDSLIGRIFDMGRARYGSLVSRFWVRLRDGWLRFALLGQLRVNPRRWWVTPLTLAVTAPVVAVAQGWSLFWEHSAIRLLMIGTLVYVALVSLLVHHAGHALAALRYRVRVREAPWAAGIVQAVALAAVSGPFVAPIPATSVEGDAEERKQHFVYLAGPLASIIFAVFLYGLYAASHVLLLHFGAVLNLSLAAASLLAVPPLEGATISEGYYTRWTFRAAIFVAAMAALVAIDSFS
jgi:tetratricopeptide (TPR) repeat protein